MSSRSLAPLALLALALAAEPGAEAGDRPYAFTQGIDGLPEREVELENWFGVFELPGGVSIWDWWLGPVVGLTDRFEAGFFARFLQIESPAAPGALVLSSLRLQLSYQLADRAAWPIDARLRLELAQPTTDGGSHEIWLTAIFARQVGRLDLTANLGGWLQIEPDEVYGWFDYALAASVDIAGGLRAGGEIYGDVRTDRPERGHYAGPAVAYGRGRIWASFSWLFGLNAASPDRNVRLVIGVLL